jgi:uncharacterized SAM-binding protein YcdF (DUF218 family)
MFVIKKLLTPLTSPYFVALLLLFGGIALLWLSARWQRLGKGLVTAGALTLLAFGFDPVVELFLRPLEERHQPVLSIESVPRDVKWIVVLGAGHATDPREPPPNRLNSGARARLLEGIRLMRALPETKLLLSGGAVWESTTHAQALADAALVLGVPRDRMVLEEESRDTVDQARIVRRMIKDEAFILVTSAYHMPRSVGLFAKEGMRPIPSPADPFVHPGNGLDPGDFFPDTGALWKADLAFHEYAGMLFAKLRGQM